MFTVGGKHETHVCFVCLCSAVFHVFVLCHKIMTVRTLGSLCCLSESMQVDPSNVSSNSLPKWMQNHTGCTCLTFLHCAFSNESSSCLPERLQIYTDSISLIFFHYGFSYVTSHSLPEKMHIHIGCISLTFLHSLILFSLLDLFHWPCFVVQYFDPSPASKIVLFLVQVLL